MPIDNYAAYLDGAREQAEARQAAEVGKIERDWFARAKRIIGAPKPKNPFRVEFIPPVPAPVPFWYEPEPVEQVPEVEDDGSWEV